MAILGIVIRFIRVRQGLKAHRKISSPEFIGTFCILSGMAFFTESWILVGLSGLSMVTWIVHKNLWGWPILIDPNLHQHNSVEAGRMREGLPVWPWVKEGLVGVAVMVSLMVLQGIKGGLPLI